MSKPHDSGQPETHLLAEYRADETTVETIVTAVAEAIGKSPLELTPLGVVVDTDALTALVSNAGEHPSSVTVTFDYCGQRVTVTTHGVRIATQDSPEE